MFFPWQKTVYLAGALVFGAALSCPATTNTVITTVAQARAASDVIYSKRPVFRFHGQIIVRDTENRMIFQDDTGRFPITFKRSIRKLPEAGSVIRVEGILYLGPHGERNLYARSCNVERQENPPEPLDLTIAQVIRGEGALSRVRISGTVVEVYPDDVDAHFSRLVLFSNGLSVDISMRNAQFPPDDLPKLLNADVRVTGICMHQSPWRRFASPAVTAVTQIDILRPAPEDPFDIKAIDDHSESALVATQCGTRKRTTGRVTAVWNGNKFLVKTARGSIFQVHLSAILQPPRYAESVTVAGLVDTDGSNLILRDAIWKPEQEDGVPPDTFTDIDARDVFLDKNGERAIQYAYYGRAVRLTGTVLTVQTSDNVGSQLLVKSGNFTIPIDVSGCPKAADGLCVGCEINVTGVCLIDFENWRQGAPFPRIRGIQLIVREPDDIRILSRPSPLTAGRLLFVIGILLLAVVAILIWNRILKSLVDRKSRELFKSQIAKAESELRIDERTRLAAELHDYTAQNLTAVSYQIAATKSAYAVGSEEASGYLDNADRMLHSCRTELRRCLWDLRSDTLDERDFSNAIRKTVATVARGATVSIRFPVKRSIISDTTAHAVLSIIRELVSNAVRHGHASSIRIAGETQDNALRFSVQDNGTGFDPTTRPGQAEGHFGLSGIAERLKRLGGDFHIDSTPGKGTRVIVSLHIQTTTTKENRS